MSQPNHLKVALAQIAPVWGDRDATIEKIKTAIIEAASNDAELIIFGEGLLPGYPYWLSLTDGAAWDTKVVKASRTLY
jgi:nitrilase